ncbi:MAG: NAD(P)-dependent dehydrogenase (short-subunit alcohol dehydrogenase family) [Limisphaerales bacterium]|jgi:NAD(P)-dependent dehydrogenase (short-subunit alcohol dehydrogenase family)
MTGEIDLTGKVALVTGGGGGIGRACALRLAERGADVVIADIEESRCQETAQQIVGRGRRALPITCDLIDTENVRAMIKEADSTFGQLDILINNVGGVRYVPFLEQSERSWRRHIDINLVSALATTSEAVNIMLRQGQGGSIINIASVEASRAGPNVAVYAACKAAIVSFTQSMALELSEHQIRVNCVSPDHTLTPGSRGNRSGPVDREKWTVRTQEQEDKLNRIVPLQREGVDTEVADVVAFLSSDLASYVTGINLPVDGGTTAAGGWHRGSKGQWTQLEGWRSDR